MSQDDYDPAWWTALERVALLVSGTVGLPFFVACEFMYMGTAVHRRRPLWLYKHGWTRMYLNLDDAGHAYRYVGARNRYVAHRSLRQALGHLELDIVPTEWREEVLCETCAANVARRKRGVI